MPIPKDASIGEIIKLEQSHGKPHDQAVAIALSVRGRSRKKSKHREAIDGAFREVMQKGK